MSRAKDVILHIQKKMLKLENIYVSRSEKGTRSADAVDLWWPIKPVLTDYGVWVMIESVGTDFYCSRRIAMSIKYSDYVAGLSRGLPSAIPGYGQCIKLWLCPVDTQKLNLTDKESNP